MTAGDIFDGGEASDTLIPGAGISLSAGVSLTSVELIVRTGGDGLPACLKPRGRQREQHHAATDDAMRRYWLWSAD